MKRFALGALGLLILVSGCGLTPNLTGTWSGYVIFDQGDGFAGLSYDLTMLIVQDGSNLSGNIGFGNVLFTIMVPIEEGTCSGDTLDIYASGHVSIIGTTSDVEISLIGQVSETSLSGTGDYVVNGEVHQFTWQASLQ